MKTSGTLIKTQGKTLGEMLYENDPGKLSALDVACIKKNRVIAAQFTSEEVIANTPHSPRPSNSILESSENSNTNFAEAEFSLVTSAYDRSRTSIQNLIQNSELLYLDPNKNRTNNWLMQLRVQFPSGQPPFGSIGTISYDEDGVNIQGKTLKDLGVEMTVAPDLDSTQKTVSEIPDEQKTSMQKALEDALKKRADTDTESDSYSTDDSAYWESMPEDQELLRNAAARDDANPEVTAWGRKQERIETLDRKANNLREAMQENETKARREPGPSL